MSSKQVEGSELSVARKDAGRPSSGSQLSTLNSQLSSSPNQRAWRRFRANRLGYASLLIFAVLFVVSLLAEVLSNDKPLFVRYDGHWYFPVFETLRPIPVLAWVPLSAPPEVPRLNSRSLLTAAPVYWRVPPLRTRFAAELSEAPMPLLAPPLARLLTLSAPSSGLPGYGNIAKNIQGLSRPREPRVRHYAYSLTPMNRTS